MSLESLFTQAKTEADLIKRVDPDDLLKELGKEKNHYLESKKSAIIEEEKQNAISELTDDKETIKELLIRLVEYRYVDTLDELHFGKQTRWIKKYSDDIYLTNGGICVGTVITPEGVNLQIKIWNGKINTIRYDDCLVFQKLSYGEQLILMASNIVNNSK